ncbi:MAG: UbiH/UbiF family hydroxylase [Betaproteobacteria bacterium]|nr:UbiH/UbiF family hydroxylase [Betaproteobacteria bacterium]
MQSFDLVIIGGGLAGASLAVALRDAPLRIALIEGAAPQRPPGWDARVYAVSPVNAAFLERIGVWRHLDHSRIAAIRAMEVHGDRGGHIGFSAYETGVPELGWILESSLMACELWESAKRQANLALFSPARPVQLAVDGAAANLELADGTRLSARLVAGADGRDSWVRGAAGLAADNRAYGQKGVVANFVAARPHRDVARQWFRPDGVLAALPLPGNGISIVWSTADDHADSLCSLAPEVFCARVAEACAGELGKLSPVTGPMAFPLRLMRVPSIVSARIALLGDAAHGIHPLSGHGINLGFRDAEALAGILAGTPAWRDIGDESLLRRYQRERREEIALLQGVTDGLQRLFGPATPGLSLLRNVGLNLTDRLSFVKNALARYALGAM